MDIQEHSRQLIKIALLDAMQFIDERLTISNLESHELVGFNDAMQTLLEYFNYTLQPEGTHKDLENFTLLHEGTELIPRVSRYGAYRAAMGIIFDEVSK